MRPESFQAGGEESKKKLKNAEKGIWGLENNLRVAIEENKERAKSLKREIQKLKEELKALKEKYKQSKEWGKELEKKAKGITGGKKELSQRDGEKEPSQRGGEKELSQRDKDRDKETSKVKPEELKFEVIEGYFEEETREGIKDSGINTISPFEDFIFGGRGIKDEHISTISPFDGFVFAGRKEGDFTLYRLNPEKGKMEVVEIEDQRKLLPGSILGSEMSREYLAVGGYDHYLKIYFRESDNPNDWFKRGRDLSDKFGQPVSGLDLYQGLVGAGSWRDDNHPPRILVYDLENNREILNHVFPEVSDICTFKFIPNTNYAVIAGSEGIRIIDYRSGRIKWTGVHEYLDIGKAVSLSPNGEEIAFTDHLGSDKIYFLNILDLKLDQESEKKQILDENGDPIGLSENYCLSYTSDGRYLVIGSLIEDALTIIDRDTMKIVKQYDFGSGAIAIDQKGNIITTRKSGKQLAYID